MNDQSDTTTDSGFILPDEISFDNVIRLGSELHRKAGGWCRTFRASRSGRHILVKALKPQFADSPLHRSLLRKEFEIGFGLSHPNIMQAISHEHVEGLGDVITCEFVDGPTLRELLTSDAPISEEERMRILSEICDAVAYMHSQGLVHRDLKPSNIMLTRRGHRVKLIDFGAADGDVWSAMKSSAGTPGYAAPEQFTSEAMTDPRVDVFAIGRIISELLPDNRSALAIAAICTDADPDRRPSDAGSIPARIARRRHAKRRLTVGAVVSAALVAGIIAGLSVYDTKRQHQLPDIAASSTDTTAVAPPITPATPAPDLAEENTGSPGAAATPTALQPEVPDVTDGHPNDQTQPLTPSNANLASNTETEPPKKQNRSQVLADSLMAILREKTLKISAYHLRVHYKLCDTVSTQPSYVRARSRYWRGDARREAERWFEPIYMANSRDLLISRSTIEKKIASFIEEYEIANAATIIKKELSAYERVGKPVPLSPHKVPFNDEERVWRLDDGSWAIHATSPNPNDEPRDR